jgi:uncharacterized protein YktA (UPF0223 family)
MKSDYQYPLDLDWSVDEMVAVTDLWSSVEEAYEKGIKSEVFLKKYEAFKKVVPSIGEEKRLGREFEQVSDYSLYRTVQLAKEKKKGQMKMEVSGRARK